MKLWINFGEKDIKKRNNGWKEGQDYDDQLIFEEEQDKSSCQLEFRNNEEVYLHFNNGYFLITKEEFGRLF